MDLMALATALVATLAFAVTGWSIFAKHPATLELRQNRWRRRMRRHPTLTILYLVTLLSVCAGLIGSWIGAVGGWGVAMTRGYDPLRTCALGAAFGFFLMFGVYELTWITRVVRRRHANDQVAAEQAAPADAEGRRG